MNMLPIGAYSLSLKVAIDVVSSTLEHITVQKLVY